MPATRPGLTDGSTELKKDVSVLGFLLRVPTIPANGGLVQSCLSNLCGSARFTLTPAANLRFLDCMDAFSPESQPSASEPLAILIVEDNPINQKVASQMLKRLGYHSDWVDNGRKAVTACTQKSYDIIFMDIHMPELDGLQATREIRRLGLSRPPAIIALTADVLNDGRQVCLAAGMDDYLTKPIRIDGLQGAVEQVLHQRRRSESPTSEPE